MFIWQKNLNRHIDNQIQALIKKKDNYLKIMIIIKQVKREYLKISNKRIHL